MYKFLVAAETNDNKLSSLCNTQVCLPFLEVRIPSRSLHKQVHMYTHILTSIMDDFKCRLFFFLLFF